jgi:hypothetical protein
MGRAANFTIRSASRDAKIEMITAERFMQIIDKIQDTSFAEYCKRSDA